MGKIDVGYELRKYHPDKGDEVIATSHDLQRLDRTALEMNSTLEDGDETLYHAEDANQPLFKRHGN